MAGTQTTVDISMVEQGSRSFNEKRNQMDEQIQACQRLNDNVQWTGDAAEAFRALWKSTRVKLETVREALGETGKTLGDAATNYRRREKERQDRLQGITIPALGNFGQEDAFQ